MFAASRDGALPKGYGTLLLALHDRKPYPSTPEEIAESAASVRDRNFRIEVARNGIHAYSKGVHVVGEDALGFYPRLGVEDDAGHAFYLGTELAKAETAWRLGKRYVQDEALDFGVAADRVSEASTHFKEAGPTRKGRDG
jgi:hypothetical protein